MKQGVICATVSVIFLVVGLAAPPDRARAEGGRGMGHDGHAGVPPAAPSGAVPRPVVPPSGIVPPSGVVPYPILPRPVVSRPFVHRPFTPPAYGVPVYVPSPVSPDSAEPYAPPPPYDPAALYAPPMDVVLAEPPPPPAPSVIEYPTGRYELRGDGVMTPYMWVWVPNPPPAPPAAPPAASPVPPVPSAPPGPSPADSEIYRFTDEQGVVNWTDRWDSIPKRYQSQAKRLPL
jgi:hypothetical protein